METVPTGRLQTWGRHNHQGSLVGAEGRGNRNTKWFDCYNCANVHTMLPRFQTPGQLSVACNTKKVIFRSCMRAWERGYVQWVLVTPSLVSMLSE